MAIRRSPPPSLLTTLARVALLFSILLVVGCGIAQEWRSADWFLWPLDNLLRVVDIADLFQIFQWRLHQVEMTLPMKTMGLVFRLCVGFYVLRWLYSLRLRIAPGLGFTFEQLLEALTHPDLGVRVAAARELGRMGPEVALRPLPATAGGKKQKKAPRSKYAPDPPGWSMEPGLIGRLVESVLDRSAKLARIPVKSPVRAELWLAVAGAINQIDPSWAASKRRPGHDDELPGMRELALLAAGLDHVEADVVIELVWLAEGGGASLPGIASAADQVLYSRDGVEYEENLADRRSLEKLLASLERENRRARERIARLLDETHPEWNTSRQAPAVLHRLLHQLHDRSERRQAVAAHAIGLFGYGAGFTVPELISRLAEAPELVFNRLLTAIKQIRGDELQPEESQAMQQQLEDRKRFGPRSPSQEEEEIPEEELESGNW